MAKWNDLTDEGETEPDDQEVHQVHHVAELAERHEELPRQELVDGAAVAGGAGERHPADRQCPAGAVGAGVERRRQRRPDLALVERVGRQHDGQHAAERHAPRKEPQELAGRKTKK